MRRVLLAVVLGLALGCGKGSSPAPTGPTASAGPDATAPKDESAALFEQLRAGAYQIDAAMGGMEKAMNLVRPLAPGKPAETKEALQTIADLLDSAGATVVEFNEAPPLDAIKADFGANDDRRLKAIEEANDAHEDVETARGYVTDLLASGPPADVRETLERIEDAVEETLDALEAAIEAFGGKVERSDADQ